MARTRRYPVKAAKTTFDIIEALRALDGAGVSELSATLDMPKSTVHDHLRTLEAAEYLIHEDDTYRIGARFLELGGYARHRMKVYRTAKPEVQSLSDETGEHANLMIEEHGMGIFLYKSEGGEAVHLDTYAGMRAHLQTTALGKAILAHYPRDRVESIIDRHGLPQRTPNTVTDPTELFEELADIRERGYATDDEERVEGVRCVAAPIRGADRVFGSVSISAPKSRMEGERFDDELPKLVLRRANVIEVNMKYL